MRVMKLTETDYELTYKTYLECGESYTRGARKLGMARSSFTNRILATPSYIKVRIDSEFYAKNSRPRKDAHPQDELFVKHNESAERKKFPRQKLLVIGDRHQAPGTETETLYWINSLIKDNDYDRIVIMGDWWDFNSVSFYDKNDTIGGKMKPVFKADLDAGAEALDIVLHGVNDKTELDFIEGNHEYRIFRYEDSNPEVEGCLTDAYISAIVDRGLRYHEFRSVVMIDGVGFVHVPYGAYGKEIRGKYPETVIGREATCDIIFAHTHRNSYYPSPKLGPRTSVNCLNVGCSLADGHVEPYARHSLTGWKYGVCEVVTQDSQIDSHSFLSMKELEYRYR